MLSHHASAHAYWLLRRLVCTYPQEKRTVEKVEGAKNVSKKASKADDGFVATKKKKGKKSKERAPMDIMAFVGKDAKSESCLLPPRRAWKMRCTLSVSFVFRASRLIHEDGLHAPGRAD